MPHLLSSLSSSSCTMYGAQKKKKARHTRRQAGMNGKQNRKLKQTMGDINNGVMQ